MGALSTNRGWLVPVGLALVLGGFGWMAKEIGRHPVLAWDVEILQALHAHSSPLLDSLMLGLSRVGGFYGLVFPGLAVWGLLAWQQQYRLAAFWALAAGGAGLANLLLKAVFQRERPDLWVSLAPEYDYSFPSGHAMGSAAFVLALGVVLWPTRWRYWAMVLGLAFALGVGASRLYLGVHYPSDVLAGWVAALGWVGLVGFWLKKQTNKT